MTAPIGTDLDRRCKSCGFDPDAMGHRSVAGDIVTGCEDSGPLGLKLARQRRDQGMARAESAHPDDVTVVDAAIKRACATGQPFSANDFRHLVTDLEQPNVIGSRIRSWVASKRIKNVGYVPSTDPATHAHKIGLYVPTERAA